MTLYGKYWNHVQCESRFTIIAHCSLEHIIVHVAVRLFSSAALTVLVTSKYL